MTTTTTKLASALDYAWACIREENPDVPEAIIVTGRRRHRGEMNTRGSHCAETWEVVGKNNHRLAEVWISGERLADGPQEAMCTLLHEAVHALAAARGIKDTSNRNRYHNKEFARLAVEVGLEPPEASGGPASGYSNCSLPEKTAVKYTDAISRIADTCARVPRKLAPDTAPKKARQFAVCGCPDARIPWSRANAKYVEEFGPVVHTTCGQELRPEEGL